MANAILLFYGRGDGIRTRDLCVPNAALYQTEPHPDKRYIKLYIGILKEYCVRLRQTHALIALLKQVIAN